MRMGERTWGELAVKEAVRVHMPRHKKPAFRHALETGTGIVGLVPDENDEVVAESGRLAEPFTYERPADADILARRVDRERSKQQRVTSGPADLHRPEADRADKPEIRVTRHE